MVSATARTTPSRGLPMPFLDLRVSDRIMTIGVSGNDLHPVSDEEAKRLERAAVELIVQRLKG